MKSILGVFCLGAAAIAVVGLVYDILIGDKEVQRKINRVDSEFRDEICKVEEDLDNIIKESGDAQEEVNNSETRVVLMYKYELGILRDRQISMRNKYRNSYDSGTLLSLTWFGLTKYIYRHQMNKLLSDFRKRVLGYRDLLNIPLHRLQKFDLCFERLELVLV